MDKNFTPVSLDGSRDFYSLWQRTPRRSLDYTLPNLWGWQEYYGLEWCFDDALCWIRQTRPLLGSGGRLERRGLEPRPARRVQRGGA